MEYYVIFSPEYGGYIKNYTHMVDFRCEPKSTRKKRFTNDLTKAQLHSYRRQLHDFQGWIPSCYGIPVKLKLNSLQSFR